MLTKPNSSSTNNSKIRLMKDLSRVEKEGEDSIFASPTEDNIYKWDAIICGPENTPWEGGAFKLEIIFSEEYPMKAPNIKFISNVFHPNGRLIYLYRI